jgi:branched-chain amino acid transport system permease protein
VDDVQWCFYSDESPNLKDEFTVSMTIFQLLNGATFAALLFVVASGFTLIFGLMRIVNLAHGALYLFGGYLGLTVANLTGNFFLGAIGAAVGIALIGLIIDFGLLRFVRGVELRQVLLTLGVAFVLNDLALVLWGGDTFSIQVPAFLDGPAEFGKVVYPIYRLFVLLVGIVIFISLSLLITKTRLGALIRAGVDDAETVSAMGVDIRRVFISTFMLGAALAGLGGVMGGAFLTLYPTADSEILVYSLAVVIIGGRGSLIGAAVGSLLVGMLSTFGQVWFPELAYFVIFGPMAILLAFRPLGLFGKVA